MNTMKRKILLACVQNQAFRKEDKNYNNPVSVTLNCQLKAEPSDYWVCNTFYFNK